jgi:hypothetical protein
MDNNDNLKDLYATPEDRIDTLLDRSRAAFWIALHGAMNSVDIKDPEEIVIYVAEEFGVQLEVDHGEFGSRGFKPVARIIDEQKYLVFLLKYQS